MCTDIKQEETVTENDRIQGTFVLGSRKVIHLYCIYKPNKYMQDKYKHISISFSSFCNLHQFKSLLTYSIYNMYQFI
jgi:hypothetical protein